MSKRVIDEANQWVLWDPNPETRAVVASLIEEANSSKLSDIFSHHIKFGTAGLRAPMGPGTSSMNDLVVIQTTQGLSNYLLKTIGQEAKEKVRLSERPAHATSLL